MSPSRCSASCCSTCSAIPFNGSLLSLEHKLADLQHTENREHFMRVLHAYELEAAGFGMQLMHQVGVTALDQWFSDFVETDWQVRRALLPDGHPCPTGSPASSAVPALVTAVPLPELRHRQVEVRFAF